MYAIIRSSYAEPRADRVYYTVELYIYCIYRPIHTEHVQAIVTYDTIYSHFSTIIYRTASAIQIPHVKYVRMPIYTVYIIRVRTCWPLLSQPCWTASQWEKC